MGTTRNKNGKFTSRTATVAKNQYDVPTSRKTRGRTGFDAERGYDKNGKSNNKHERNAPWKQMTYSTKESARWRPNNSMKKGDVLFGKKAVVEGHLKTDENGNLSRRQKYYDVRVGMGLVGG